jgi:HlyD family secretion protein
MTAMNWKKIGIIAGGIVVVGAIVGFTVVHNQQGVVAVQIGTVKPEDLSSVVTASGEINSKYWANIGANAFGKITKLYVKEGDHVKKGQLLAQLENVQPTADVHAQQATVQASLTDEEAAQAAVKTAQADLARTKADLDQKGLDYTRAQSMLKAGIIAQSDFDAKKAAYQTAEASVEQAEAQLAQSRAQLDSAVGHVKQNRATLVRLSDMLSKTTYSAPFDGTVTNLPVREGETVVVGIQNSPGSTLMTLADLSTITAEVRVDETDIIDVKLGQPAEVTIDAIPNKTFHGTVTQIGDNAIVRSTGVATTQTTGSSEEAKDFKVVITLQDPPSNLRPGLSTTAKITTATRHQVLAVPIQALTEREQKDLQDNADKKGTVQAASQSDSDAAAKKELQGVFVIQNNHAKFVPVTTGITGTTDIEVLSGLKEGDRIVTGSYKVLRSLRNNSRVKEEKMEVKTEQDTSSS